MVIDAHQHFWQYHPKKQPWIDDSMAVIRRDFMPEDLPLLLQQNDIDGCVAVQADQTLAETDFLLQLAQEHTFIRGVVGWVDLRSDGLDAELEKYSTNKKLKGWRHVVQGEADHNFLLRPKFLKGISKLQRYGHTYDILVFPHQLGAVLEFVKRFPNQKFVIDHIAKPYIKDGFFDGWAVLMREIAQYKNVYCKLSGMVTEADHQNWKSEHLLPYIEHIVQCFSPERVMFGSDWPVCQVAGSYVAVKNVVKGAISTFSPQEQTAIMGTNAIEFYNL